jgi:putative tryptophan/tyrosine transport system substrate-binding protein
LLRFSAVPPHGRLSARAQQPSLPVIAFLSPRSADASVRVTAAFRKGLNETGYVEGQNVTVEYHWLEGRYDRLPALLADLVRRQVAVMAIPGSAPAVLAAKAATATIPIIFGVGEDPVGLGLVANLARPSGNATGINFFVNEVVGKRLRLLHDMVQPRSTQRQRDGYQFFRQRGSGQAAATFARHGAQGCSRCRTP